MCYPSSAGTCRAASRAGRLAQGSPASDGSCAKTDARTIQAGAAREGRKQMSTSSAIAGRATEAPRAAIAGDVFVPGDHGYDEARRAWNLAIDQRPAAVVFAESATDVTQAVRFARAQGMRIAPQGTGHGSEPLEPLQGAMLLKTSRMRQVEINPAARTARAEAGALWQDVTFSAGEHGLAALAGTSPDVGVTGYTLGGGIGWLARRYGLAANSITAAEIVTPDGHLARADAGHEPDLLWAVKGGGGSVGVVTALEMTLYPVRQLYAGALFFPIQRSAQVLHAWRAWTDTVPDEVTSLGRILRFPPVPEVPGQLRGRAFALVEAAYLGDEATGAELIRPLRQLGPDLDTFATIPAAALSRLHMDPGQPVPNQGDGEFLADAPAAAIDALLALAGPAADTPLASVEVRHLGGTLARPAPSGGAQPQIDAKYLMFAGGFTPTPELAAVVRAQARAVKDALTPWHAGYDYYNFAETPAGAHRVLPPASYRRLQQIKGRYDPGQAIISTHPVWPGRH
jgi:FAD/FMN-containing dehydrogenase